MPWEVLEHTADAGVRVRAGTVAGLFEEGARATTDTIVDVTTVRPAGERHVRVQGIDEADLLVRFLGELVYLYDVERFLTAEARVVELTATSCAAVVRGEAYDPGRHAVKTEVKAVTYHASGIREVPGGFEADVIYDL